jgi:hypothetical protein
MTKEEIERERITSEYEDKLRPVLELNTLTSTPGWRRFYDRLVSRRKDHEISILTEEQTRRMVAHQEAIKFIQGLLCEPKQPIEDLNAYCSAMPLFATEFHTRAQWNPGLGTVELRESR